MEDRAAALVLPLRSTNAGSAMPECGAKDWHRVQMSRHCRRFQQGG